MIRYFWVLVHRYAGLTMTVFLIIVGLTGSLLAFYPELNRLVTPKLFPPPQNRPTLLPGELAERALWLYPNAKLNAVILYTLGTAQINLTPGVDPRTEKPYQPEFNQLFLDPYSGAELGRRKLGDAPDGLDTLMPFIYRLHDALAMGKPGAWILGAVAVIWTLDCFIGFYLTLPKQRQQGIKQFSPFPSATTRKSWLQRWLPAWRIRWHAGSYKLNFDLHRAVGLWVWFALLIFAWSSVMFNMKSVYTPVTAWLFDYPHPDSIWSFPKLDKPLQEAKIGWRQAQDIAERKLAEQGQVQGFSIERPTAMYFNRPMGIYGYWVRSSLDLSAGQDGHTVIAIDAVNGEVKELHLPTGQTSGRIVTEWLAMLHMARVFGLPYRIFVCVLGLLIVQLSITGVIMWLRKRRARSISKGHRSKVTRGRLMN